MKKNKKGNGAFGTKAIFLLAMLAAALVFGLVLTGCPTSTGGGEKHLTYTVLYYNATLKPGIDTQLMLPYLMEVLDVGASDTVNFAAQVNFEWDLQNLKNGGAWAGPRETKRFWAKKGKSDSFEYANPGALLKLSEPNTIADFIRWGTDKFPADRYILVMMGHGAVWNPAYDKNDGWAAPSPGPVRANISSYGSEGALKPLGSSVFDDNITGQPGISSFALAEGIKRAGKKIDMVYHHACLQNMLENLCELQVTGLVNYVLAAGHNTSSVGGDYGSLLNFLNTGADLEEVISQYCWYNVKHMEVSTGQSELIFTDLRKLDPVLASIKKIVDVFTAIQGLESLLTLPVKTDRETSGVYFYDAQVNPFSGIPELDPANWISADINSYIQHMNAVLNYYAISSTGTPLSAYSTDLLKAINAAIVWGEDTSSIPIYTTFAVTVMPKDMYTAIPGYSTYYPRTAFDKATNWSKWLSSDKNMAVHRIIQSWSFEGLVKYAATENVLVVTDTNITANSKVEPAKLKVGSTALSFGVNYLEANVVNGAVIIRLGGTTPLSTITVGSTTVDILAGFVTTNKQSNTARTGITIGAYP
ncbi:hypothetical protein AGMMS49546_09610 [Spirochaetia bacterium]|nr:hypothetical protein AGMMS49546_09610 [Spirochaetia bacterium]